MRENSMGGSDVGAMTLGQKTIQIICYREILTAVFAFLLLSYEREVTARDYLSACAIMSNPL